MCEWECSQRGSRVAVEFCGVGVGGQVFMCGGWPVAMCMMPAHLPGQRVGVMALARVV